MQHSVFGASSAERWANCAGSIVFCRGVPKTDSDAAREGTSCHAVGDLCLRTGTDAEAYIGQVFEGVEVTDDMADATQIYIDYVRSLPGFRMSEQRINYSALLGVPFEEGFGTGDAIVLCGPIVDVCDAKFGRRFVNPQNNKQMMLYGAGVVDALEAIGEEIQEIRLHVVQPRVSEKPIPFVLTRAELAEQIAWLRERAQLVIEAGFNYVAPGLPEWTDKYLTPGESQCQWCPAAASCPSLRKKATSMTPIEEFDLVNSLEAMTSGDLARNHALIPLVEIWIKAVEHEVLRRLTRRDHVPGYKLVTGREGNRRWASEDAVKEAFENVPALFAEPKLLTPPQLEKLWKKDPRKAKIAELVVRNPARPTVSTADDPRPEWVEAAAPDEFGVVA